MGQEPIKDLAEASLEQLMNIKVYSASKHLQTASEAPSSVTVITAEEIQTHGYRTLADILRTVRGFHVTYDRNYSYLGVRDFNRPGDYNGRVLLLIDGHRVNDNIYDQAPAGTELPLDIDLIARVEIIRGPSSSLYGSNAFLAIVNIITKKGRELDGWELSFEPGSFDTLKGRVSYGGQVKGVETLLSASFYDSGGQNLFFPEFNSPDTNNGIAENRDYDRYYNLLLTTSFRGLRLQGVFGRRTKGIPTAPYGTVFNDPSNYSVDEHRYLDLSYKRVIASWELGARTYYDRYAYDGVWPYAGGVTNVDYVRGQNWGTELQLGRTFLQKHHLTLGTELLNKLQQDQKNYDAPGSVYVNDQRSSWMWAGFVQEEYAITRQLTLNVGVRHDRYTRYGGSTNPRLGLIYRPFEKTSFKLLYGTAFRVPNVYEAYYGTDSVNNALFELNPSLAPESIKNMEVIWEQEMGKSLHLSAAVFRNYINGLISLQEDPDNGLLVFRNADKARGTGVEFELGGHLPRGLVGSLNYTFTAMKDQSTGQTMVNSPRHLAKFKLTTPLYQKRLFAGMDALYEGSRPTLAGNLAPAFPVINLTFLGHAWTEHLDLSASVYNLLDRKYFDVAPAETVQDTLQQDGRSFRVKLTWHWGRKQ